MKEKINVGILGATGMVGQNFIRLLEDHPWFNIRFLAASERSAGKSYREAVEGRWHMDGDIPESAGDLRVDRVGDLEKAAGVCSLVFSALSMDKASIRDLENRYAAAGLTVVSNNSAHRNSPDVPILIPEINGNHLDIAESQRQRAGRQGGLIIVKPNCSVQSYITPLYAVMAAGYRVDRVLATTLQAVSGAGYPGVPSYDCIDNVYALSDEEAKFEREHRKIFGQVSDGVIRNDESVTVSAHCNRVPVIHGHTACVSVGFAGKKPSKEEIIRIWNEFRGEPQERNLPSAPAQPVVYREEKDRPQPRLDRDNQNGMGVTTGRLRDCPILDYKFTGLCHNTVRGAAGGALLMAELIAARMNPDL